LQRLVALEPEFKQFGAEVISIAKDLFNRDDAFSLYHEVKTHGLQVDVLVNDAGQGVYGEFEHTDIDRELKIIDLNISSLVVLTKLFLKDMLAKGSGKILNVGSIASKLPGPWQAVYHGTKAFVLSFSEAIREENKDKGVVVTVLMPGATDTDFFHKADMLSSKAVQDKESLSDPQEVAKDGFEALLAGKDKVVSGFKNKMQVQMSNITPDSMVAHQVYEQQKPIGKD
jgi:short-subunit dehydrogenase